MGVCLKGEGSEREFFLERCLIASLSSFSTSSAFFSFSLLSCDFAISYFFLYSDLTLAQSQKKSKAELERERERKEREEEEEKEGLKLSLQLAQSALSEAEEINLSLRNEMKKLKDEVTALRKESKGNMQLRKDYEQVERERERERE